MITWAQIDDECKAGDFRSRVVATFRKHEGEETDERDKRGGVVKVTATSFARHFGLEKTGFLRWVKGHSAPSPKPKQPQPKHADVESRRDKEVAMRNKGASIQQIAKATGVSQAVVRKDLQLRGRTNAQQPQRTKLPVDPAPVQWRSDPVPDEPKPEPPMYQRSATVQLITDTLTTLKQHNMVNCLANDAHDADNAADERWVTEASEKLQELLAYLERLRRVLHDPEMRRRGIADPKERDDVGPRLRMVGEAG